MSEKGAGERQSVAESHPIGEAIDRFIHRVRDTKLAARVHIPLANDVIKQQVAEIRQRLDRLGPLIDASDPKTAAPAQKEVAEVMLRLRRLQNSDVPGAIEGGLFLTLFASFDAFTGDLLRGLYTRKPELFKGLNRSVAFGDILSAASIDHLKADVLEEEIESLRRKSYAEQFAALGSKFDITLTALSNWAAFVECSQRRNLLTHCDGIVSDQYVKACRDAGVRASDLPKAGDRSSLGARYFFASCELMIEVGLKLGQTLWRKALPRELERAEEHLRDTLFDTLESRMWKRARMMGEFAMSQKQWATDRNRKTVLVNYVQALKRDGAKAEALEVLASVDWSAARAEFQLADQVLREDYDAAAVTMQEIGPSYPLLKEHAYHIWPLFLEFRETDQFARAYLSVFGHKYSAKLGEEVAEAQKSAEQEAVEHSAVDGGEGNEAKGDSHAPAEGLEGLEEGGPKE